MKQFSNLSMHERLSKIKSLMQQKNIDALLISSIPNITYLTDYSGFSKDEREAYLLITPSEEYLFTDGRYAEAVVKHIPHFKLVEIKSDFPLQKALQKILKKHRVKRLGIEEKNLTLSEFKKLFNHSNDTYYCSDRLAVLRSLKEPREIAAIEKACQLGDKAFRFILNKINPQVTEQEIAFELEFFIKRQGAELSFPSIVAFGANASIPHHQTSNKKIENNNFVLLDFGVKLNNYCSDMTRTIFFGKASSKQKMMYQTVLSAQQKAIDFITKVGPSQRSDLYAREVDTLAREYIISQGYPSIPHSLGHGIGIEVHEAPHLSPTSKELLKPGMVFSLEPGIYISGFGGVRIEDLVVLEKNEARLLTKSNRELIEI